MTRVIKILITYAQIKLAFPQVIQVHWPDSWLQFLRYFRFLNIDVLDIIGTTCIAQINFTHRFAALCSLPFLVAGATYIQHRISVAKAAWTRAHVHEGHASVRGPKRAAAESLFDSVQHAHSTGRKYGATHLSVDEMHDLLKQMTPKDQKFGAKKGVGSLGRTHEHISSLAPANIRVKRKANTPAKTKRKI